MDGLLDQLNPPQREAVTMTEGPLLIIAGAGSGKTRVITYRVAYLVRECGVSPGQIFAATFTNKAADEMRERVRRLLGGDCAMPFAISTFHSWCAGVLRREAERVGIARDFTICDEDDQLSVLKEVFRGLGLDLKHGTVTPTQARWEIDQAKMRLEGPEAIRQRKGDPRRAALYAEIYEAYQQMLRRNNALDFGDLIAEVVRLFETDAATLDRYQEHYRYLMVDEYQDTNHVQYRLVSALARKYRNLCVVGDEDQSIYSWRGANIGNLLDFQAQFPDARLIRLEQNYRSTPVILDAASRVIARNSQRLGKTLWTERRSGPPILTLEADTDRDEADQVVNLMAWLHDDCLVPYRDMAVFYRTNALSRLFEERLRGANIPYRVVGAVRFYDRKEIKDLLAYLRVIANPHDSMALQRIINTPRRGIGDRTVSAILALTFRENLTFYEAIEKLRAAGQLLKGADRKLCDFVAQLKDWAQRSQKSSIAALLDAVIKETGYIESLGDPESLEVVTRCENIEELKNAVVQFERERTGATLTDFLEYTALRTSVDDYDAEDNSVSLMTLHCAKGLEFRVVFLVALEKDIFPHVLAVKQGGIEEERRLFYVGLTRARELVCLSNAMSRWMHGDASWSPPSVFLREVPRELCQPVNRTALSAIRDELRKSAPAQTMAVPKTHSAHRRTGAEPAGEKMDAGVRRTQWEVGQAIVHPTLGRGVIAGVRGSGGNQMLDVQFEDGPRMEFMARFARLKRTEAAE
ncbi:MAG: UvrD-helicase domain-containing protein [Candidatus Sumerlaeia bacterium]|nr:UvrD-helicase domain-containing protein [Candidatus Sumerlaeia bacterium]